MKELDEKNIEKQFVKKSDFISNSYLSNDALEDFKKRMNKYPVLNNDENERLALLSQYGDKEALEKLVNHNLRLVLSEASKYFPVIKHLKPMDLIQEGCIGIVEAAYVFDPKKGAFTTCAVTYIRKNVRFVIKNSDDEIRKPVNLKGAEYSYKKLISEYLKNGIPIPSDEELCELLKITKENLEYFKNAEKLIPTSMNKKTKEDDEETELGDFIKDESDNYNSIIDKIDNIILFAIIKSILKPLEYFVLYYRYLSDNRNTLEGIGDEIGVTRERIRQLEIKSLEKIKPYMDKSKSLYKKTYDRLVKEEKIDSYNIKPIEPKQIIMYLYIKEKLNDIERKVLYYQFFGKYKIEWYLKKISLSFEEYKKINENIVSKIREVYENIDEFKEFGDEIISEYQTKIYKIKLSDEEIIDFENLKNIYGELTYEEVLRLIEKYQIVLNKQEEELLQRYFKIPSNYSTSKEYVEKEIYLLAFGYKNKSVELSPKKLYSTYLKYIEEFDEEQRDYFECCFFNPKRQEEFYNKYPNSKLIKQKLYLIRRLERMYYHINEFSYKNFNKEKYLFVKENFSKKLTPERIKELDMYYGVNGRKYSIPEIAELCKEDYIKVHDRLKTSRDFCMSLYYNRSAYLTSDLERYIPYILDNSIELTDETRNILKLFIIDEISYEEIRNKTGLSRSRISNIITDGVRKLDFYRYGFFIKEKVLPEDLEEFLKVKGNLFGELEKKVIFLRKIKTVSINDITKVLNIDKEKVNKIISKFNKTYRKYQADIVILTDEDILKEINTHITESVISDSCKEILSYYYGLKTRFNPNGDKLSISEILNKLSITKNVFWHSYLYAHDYIKAKKLGLHKNDLSYISRDELNNLLDDPHLPISDKERDIICYLFELKGYPYKSLKELSTMFDENDSSLRRRYQRSILTIYKYLNHEIDGKINYETDILPNLKYFSKSDILLIEEYFKNNLSYKEISQKYNIKIDRVIDNIIRINDYIYDLLNDEEIRKFDFEFYREYKYDPKLPFYGNRELAIQIFDLYFGETEIERLSLPAIIKRLKLDSGDSILNTTLYNFMLSFCKLKDGIEKVNILPLEEIKKYYDEHYEKMSHKQKAVYENYFYKRENPFINKNESSVNSSITYDILKAKYPNFFDLKKAMLSEVIRLIKEFYNKMDISVREYLMTKFRITEKEFMNRKEIYQVYEILNKIELQKKKKTNEIVLKRKLDI